MHKKTVISVLLAMSLASSGLAFGQGHSGRHDRDDDRGRGRVEQDHRDNRRHPDRRPDHNRGYHDERGGGPSNSWHRGDRIPVEYRSRQYVVDDWRGHRLSAPPRGYHWVQSGGDYILVAVATGVILQMLINN
jgi:Ni/Co efflux regulator RcnB